MNSRIAESVLRQLGGLHLFSTAAISRAAATRPAHSFLAWSAGMRTAPATWVASVRFVGTVPVTVVGGGEAAEKGGAAAADVSAGGKKEKAVVSYWGMAPAKVFKEDGTEWKWPCFGPRDSYTSNLSIDLEKHHVPIRWGDKLARWTVKTLRVPTDIFFQPMIWTVH